MRTIPGKTKIKIELFKGISLADILVAVVTMGLAILFATSSLPGKFWIAGTIVLVGFFLLVRIDADPNYIFVLHIMLHLIYPKRFGKKGIQMEEDSQEISEREQEWIALSEKERTKLRKEEDKKLADPKVPQEEKDELRAWQKTRSENAMRRMAYAKEKSIKRTDMAELMPFTDISDNLIAYGSDYLGAVIEIPPVEFRFFSQTRRNASIEQALGGVLRTISADYAANIVKIERPVVYDAYLQNEYSKIDEVRLAFEHGLLGEKELMARVEIIRARIEELEKLSSGSRIVAPCYYLVLFEADKRQLEMQVKAACDSLIQGDLKPKRLNNKELAVFLRYTNEVDFDEREIESVAPEDYAAWAMPRQVDITAKGVMVNRFVTHNFRVIKFPALVGDAWLAGVFSMPATKCIIKCKPLDRTKAIRNIDHSLTELRGRYAATGVDSRRIELREHIQTLSQLLATLQGENETLLEVNVYVTAYDLALTRMDPSLIQPPLSDRRRFNGMKKAVKRLYKENGMALTDMSFDQLLAFIATQVSAYDPFAREGRGIPSNTVAASYPWIFASVADKKGIHLGSQEGMPVFIDFFRRDEERLNSNLVVVGKSGSGKSYSTKSLLCNLAADDSKIFILDPENEYAELAKNLNGKFINVANAQHGRLNPFHVITALEDDESEGGQESSSYATHLQFLEEFFSQILPDCEKDALEYLNSLVERTYAQKGIDAYTDFKSLSPEDYPIFDDLYDVVLMEFQQTKNDYIRSMLRVLMNYIAKFSTGGRNSNIWNGPSTITTEENFTVFNFQSLLANRNMTVANAQMLLVLKYIDNEIIKNRDYNTKYNLNRKVIVVIDEAHVFIDTKYPAALDFMFQLAKRIRKYNGMQIVITQNIKDFVGSEEIARKSTAIINACQYSMIFSLAPNDMEDLCKLYEKAGGINKQEQEQIISAQRGNAFTILGPDSRTSFKVEVPENVQKIFSDVDYRSPYFFDPEGLARWEEWIADSRARRAEREGELAVIPEAETAFAGEVMDILTEEEQESAGEVFGGVVSFVEVEEEELELEEADDAGESPEALSGTADEKWQRLQQAENTPSDFDIRPSADDAGIEIEMEPEEGYAERQTVAGQPSVGAEMHSGRVEELLSGLMDRFSYDAMQAEVARTVKKELTEKIPQMVKELVPQTVEDSAQAGAAVAKEAYGMHYAGAVEGMDEEFAEPEEMEGFEAALPAEEPEEAAEHEKDDGYRSLDEILAELDADEAADEEDNPLDSMMQWYEERMQEIGSSEAEDNEYDEDDFSSDSLFGGFGDSSGLNYSPITLMETLGQDYIEVTLEELTEYNNYVMRSL